MPVARVKSLRFPLDLGAEDFSLEDLRLLQAVISRMREKTGITFNITAHNPETQTLDLPVRQAVHGSTHRSHDVVMAMTIASEQKFSSSGQQ